MFRVPLHITKDPPSCSSACPWTGFCVVSPPRGCSPMITRIPVTIQANNRPKTNMLGWLLLIANKSTPLLNYYYLLLKLAYNYFYMHFIFQSSHLYTLSSKQMLQVTKGGNFISQILGCIFFFFFLFLSSFLFHPLFHPCLELNIVTILYI